MRWTRRSPATPAGSRSTLEPGNRLTVTDNGRGIPVDAHPKYPGKSALEVILTTLHSGGKFAGKAYATSGGLHGVGVSVVNALSTETIVEVARDKKLYRQTFAQGPRRPRRSSEVGADPEPARHHRRLHPRSRDFRRRRAASSPARLYRLARSKAYLFAGVEIRWRCDPVARRATTSAESAVFQFPGGLADHLARADRRPRMRRPPPPFTGRQDFPDGQGSVEWAVAWPLWSDGDAILLLQHHPDPRRRHPRAGLRAALTKGIRAFGELVGQKKAKDITGRRRVHRRRDDALGVHPQPAFPEPDQGPADLARGGALGRERRCATISTIISPTIWTAAARCSASSLERMDERLKRRAEREIKRKTATSRAQAAPARQAHRLRQ